MVVKKKILMLDDELPENLETPGTPTPYMWYYAKAVSDSPEFELFLAPTQTIARHFFDSEVFDIVSMDVIMPGSELEKTKNNTRTGLAFLDWMIERKFSGSVVVLSLIDKDTLSLELPKNRGSIKSLAIVEKIVTTPQKFVLILHSLRTVNEH